jgi:serine/threonine-protein kinase
MTPALFRQIGPYEIQGQIGRGGFAMVFLAKDTRPGGGLVALKVVPDGPDADAKDMATAEQRGAELQRMFLDESVFVPRVYDIGAASGYLYIAMEYLDGADLSSLIREGPLEPARAARIAIQLCQFLEEIDRMQSTVEGASPLTLLHNDLKPTNIRIVSGDRVKVLDFGAAKTLSVTRRVTRNDFYSTPYLSPECLDTGERDRYADTWALGVILYEMAAGHPPFRGDVTRRLEERIRSRRPPEPLAHCPRTFQAIVAKLLAPQPESRYAGPEAIRLDLERFLSNNATLAEQDGWPDRIDPVMDVEDEAPTRRAPRGENAPTRATHDRDDEPPTRRTPRPVVPVVMPPAVRAQQPATTPDPVATPQPARRRWFRAALVIGVIVVVTNEGCVAAEARRLAATASMQEFGGFTNLWTQYEALSGRSWLGGVAARSLGVALARHAQVLSERVIGDYRAAAPTVREAQWQAAIGVLERAVTVAPDDRRLLGTLRYCQGQLHRINGEARKSRKQLGQAQREFSDAVAAFREAASLRPDWPDPFLGLARTFIYGIEDIDRGADATNEAMRLGYTIGDRETAQLADGYRTRGDALDRSAGQLKGLPQQKEFLARSRDAYRQALDLYAKVAGYSDVPSRMRATQKKFEAMERKLLEFDFLGRLPWE